MVETPSSSAEYISTAGDAIKWTETNPNSKLNEIKGLLGKSYNQNIKNLMKLIVNKDYKKLQKEIGCTILDGKLGAKSLERVQLYVNKEKSVDTIKTKTEAQINGMKQSLATQIQQPGEIWHDNEVYNNGEAIYTGNFENQQKEEIGSGEWIIDKGERKLQTGIDMQGNNLKMEKILIPNFDREKHVVIWKETSKTLNNIFIKYIGKNICINDEYIIHPQGTICSYDEEIFLDTYAQFRTSPAQDALLKPLYDYLNKNRDKFEGKHSNTSTNNTVEDTKGSNSTQSEATESIPSNIEWKSVNITYHDVPMLDEDLVGKYGLMESLQTKKQLRINKIGKVGKEIYINQQFKVVPKRNDRGEKYYTIGQNIGGKYHEMDSSELSGGGFWGRIYEDLNRKYFS